MNQSLYLKSLFKIKQRCFIKMIRCSSISKIMTSPRTKGAVWSETAKSHMLECSREILFGVRKSLDDVKKIQKGKLLEDEGVNLYNNVFLYNLSKLPPEARKSNGIITGEADLLAISSNKGVDIKCSWSLLTFPLNEDMADKKAYEWQARGYMCLYDVDEWEVAYCMLDTPDELLSSWDDLDVHTIDSSIPLHHRITIVKYQRDKDKEALMLDKCAKANAWIGNAVRKYTIEHDKYIAV